MTALQDAPCVELDPFRPPVLELVDVSVVAMKNILTDIEAFG